MTRRRSDPLAWRRVGVYGLGRSGLAAAALLRRRGVDVVAFDRRPVGDLGDLTSIDGVDLRVGMEPVELPPGLDAIVSSPGVPPSQPLLAAARRAGLPVWQEVELAWAHLDGPVIAITGSNGKSTTTALAGALVAATGRAVEVCGNIGEPLSARVEGPPGRTFVVELSSFQLEGAELFRAEAGAFLNLAADHLDRHGDLGAYAAAKRRLFALQSPADVAVLNADDPLVAATVVPGRRRFFSRRGPVADGAFLLGEEVVEVAPGEAPSPLFALADLALEGVHNVENAMAAALLARAVGVDATTIRRSLRDFEPLPHRFERVGSPGGVVFVDDSKATNPAATIRSLESLPDRSVHLVLGGSSKGGEFTELRAAVAAKTVAVYAIGATATAVGRALGGVVEVTMARTLDRAVALAAAAARPGQIVLLAPACASFDQYRDYGERGDHFRRLVADLVEARADG